MSARRGPVPWSVGLPVGVAALAVVVPFFAATTFIGDDHLFLAFARHAPHPFAAFLTDRHGAEYYRPLPMMLWWLLGRLGGGGVFPFALLGLLLHAANALLVGELLRALGRPPVVAWTAAALMALAPENLEAALWFAASTDLLATAFVLGSLILLLRQRHGWSALAALAAFLSKESAYVLPLLAVIVCWARPSADGQGVPRARRWPWSALASQLGLLAVVIVARRCVLHGWGGSGDPRPGPLGAALQIGGGLAQLFTGTEVMPVPLAFAVGAAVLALSALGLARRGRARSRWAPLAFILVAVAPLAAAGWVVGARYFYLPAVGICWAVAEVLSRVGPAARITLAAALVLVGAAQAVARRGDVVSYEKRLAATRRAVADGLRAGHHVFHVDGGIKDVDLAVKEVASIEAGQVLVLGDVPASFAIIPPALGAASAWVSAPPLPPSGGYDFGDVRVIALARRGDEPDLEEVLAKFPDLRLIRLRTIRGGRVIARDLTDEMKARLDAAGSAGQD